MNRGTDLPPEVHVEIPAPLIRCVESCMTRCGVDCCGIDAFDLSPEVIGRWARERPANRVKQAASQAAELALRVADSRYRFVFTQLNHVTADDLAREELVWFFKQVAEELEGGGDARESGGHSN